MLYQLAIHRPEPAHERDVIASMHRFGAAASSQQGLVEVHTLKDQRSDALIGLAVWTSVDALMAARPALAAATAGDDFDAWEGEPIQMFLLEEI
jgi:hypothetical protein